MVFSVLKSAFTLNAPTICGHSGFYLDFYSCQGGLSVCVSPVIDWHWPNAFWVKLQHPPPPTSMTLNRIRASENGFMDIITLLHYNEPARQDTEKNIEEHSVMLLLLIMRLCIHCPNSNYGGSAELKLY